jgi:hypothetical protein
MSDDLVKRLTIKAGVMEMGEKIAWGSDTSLMREAADRIEELEQMLARAVEALEKIEAGLPAGSSLFDGKNPLWRDAYRDLQRVARATLAELNGETDE